MKFTSHGMGRVNPQDLRNGFYKMPLYENELVREARQPNEVDKQELEESWKIMQNPVYVEMDTPQDGSVAIHEMH